MNKLHCESVDRLFQTFLNLETLEGCYAYFEYHTDAENADEEYLERFVIESNYGIIIHLENALFGFLIMFIPCWLLPYNHGFAVWFPVFIVNFVLSMLPVFILRYTNYTLQRLHEKAQKKKKNQTMNLKL